MADSSSPMALWRHSNPKGLPMDKLRCYIEQRRGKVLQTYSELYQYSISEIANFYEDLWDFCAIIHEGQYEYSVNEAVPIDTVPDWFPGVRLNWAENILFTRSPSSPSVQSTHHREDSKIAVTTIREGGTEIRQWTWKQLRQRAGLFTQALKGNGVRKGDRIGAVCSNSFDALCLWLGTAAVGAIFSTSSTDMGVAGILDRQLQIEPTFLFMDDWAVYNGKKTDLRAKMREVVEGMREVKPFRGIVSLPRFAEPADLRNVPRSQTLSQFLEKAASYKLEFTRIGFREPFYIAYSSGSTGRSKPIVHCGGGCLMASLRDQGISNGLDHDSTFLQYTTTGWIMYYLACGGLCTGTHTILYDGSPFQPHPETLIKLVSSLGVTHLGVSPRYFTELKLRKISPREVADLSKLQVVTSTGMVLSTAMFKWFYETGFLPHTQLVNMTGGTDLAGALAIGNPFGEVYAGECMGRALGVKVEVYEQVAGENIQGKAVPDGKPGELVVTKPFPSMPVTFWGEDGPRRYYESYFTKYSHVWTQGDFCSLSPKTGGLTMLGRADGVLNPSGVRFGSGELYNVIDANFSTIIAESMAVGQRRVQDADEAVILFLLMKPGVPFTSKLAINIRDAIIRALSKRHVPKYIFETKEIPVTVNGKKVELVVKKAVCEGVVDEKGTGTLANAGCLQWYTKFFEIERFAEEKARLGGDIEMYRIEESVGFGWKAWFDGLAV